MGQTQPSNEPTTAPKTQKTPKTPAIITGFLYGNRKVLAWLVTIVTGVSLQVGGHLNDTSLELLQFSHLVFVGGNILEHGAQVLRSRGGGGK
jgi:hypothetical protein